jgi:hypothetical protein
MRLRFNFLLFLVLSACIAPLGAQQVSSVQITFHFHLPDNSPVKLVNLAIGNITMPLDTPINRPEGTAWVHDISISLQKDDHAMWFTPNFSRGRTRNR